MIINTSLLGLPMPNENSRNEEQHNKVPTWLWQWRKLEEAKRSYKRRRKEEERKEGRIEPVRCVGKLQRT